jgi:Thioredoxin domain-containing protein
MRTNRIVRWVASLPWLRDAGQTLCVRLEARTIQAVQAHIKRREFPEAIPLLERHVARRPYSGWGHHFLGFCYLGVRQWRQAEEVLTITTMLCPHAAAAWGDLGYARLRQRDFEGAIAALSQAIQKDPLHVKNRHFLVKALTLAGRHEEASGHLAFILKQDASSAQAKVDLIASLEDQERWDALGILYKHRGDFLNQAAGAEAGGIPVVSRP